MKVDCLGIQSLGLCSYLPDGTSWNILSIGDSIAAISLLLAFSQLLSLTKKEMVFVSLKQTYVIWGLAVFFLFISTILPFIPGIAIPILGFPIVWEFVAAILMLIVIVLLIYHYHSYLPFKGKKTRRTLKIVNRIILKGTEGDMAELSQHLSKSIPDIISEISKFDSVRKKFDEEDGKRYEVSERTKDAIKLVHVLEDPLFCKSIVTKNPIFSMKLFEELNRQQTNGSIIRPLIWEIVRQALINKNSILHRENSYGGLGTYKIFSLSAFSRPNFNENMLPLGHWSPILEKEVDKEIFNTFANCFLLMVDAYIEERRYYEHSFAIFAPGNCLVEFPGYLMHQIDSFPDGEVYSSFPYKCLDTAAKTIEKTIKKVEETISLSNEKYFNWLRTVEEKQDRSIVNYLSKWIYELLEAASGTRKYDFQLRSSLIDLWMAIYSVHGSGEPSPLILEIQRRLEKLLFKQLKTNLEEGWYPAISRVLISILGLYYPKEILTNEDRFRHKFYDYLKANFLSLYSRDKERALDKLPANTYYDVEKNRLVQKVGKWREDRIISLD